MRHTVTIAVAAAISATSVSYAVAQATEAPPARSAATDRAVVNQLQKLNSTAKRSETRLQEARDEIKDLKRGQATFCRAIAERSYSCPSSF